MNYQPYQAEPEVLHIISVDTSYYDSAEWFSRVRYKLSQSQSINQTYRWVCWAFRTIPEALTAIQKNPSHEFIYLRIDPSEEVIKSFSNGNKNYLEKSLAIVEKRNCIVVYEADHTNVSGISAKEEKEQADTATDLIKQALEKRSLRTELISARIDDVSNFGREAIQDIRRQITVLTGRCDRIDQEMETLEAITVEHEQHLKKIRTWYGRGKGILGAIGKKAVIQGLGLLGTGAGIKWLVDVILG